MPTSIPHEARCLTCGYLLRDLPAPTCPECGREFDPNDPKSYDAEPLQSRRRKWVRRGVVVAGIVVLLIAFAPRKIMRSSITFTCAQCQTANTLSRFEPRPPDWIGVRYPGLSWRSTKAPPIGAPPVATTHVHQPGPVAIQSDLWSGGRCTGNGSGRGTRINGIVATTDSAPDILKQMMDPTNNGITIGSTPPPIISALKAISSLFDSEE